MAATPKHRRSPQRRKMTRGSDRFNKLLTKFKKIKKYGGTFVSKPKGATEAVIAHAVSKNSTTYKGIEVLQTKK